MAVYSGFGFGLSTTPALAVAAEPVDRAITISPAVDARVRVGFDNTSGFLTGPGGPDFGSSASRGSGANVWYTQFVLPADQELWLWVDAGSSGCDVLVSKAPGI